jgi:3' terminal RNA ribose 2'-O-methyltransferase Hen1
MLLTITNATAPATDLGFLLHKHPANVRSVDMSFGRAHVFFPDATDERCTAALLLDVDPISLVRRRRGRSGFALAQYVNDRPYVASSFMSVAIAKVFGTALSGRSQERSELVDAPLDLTAHVPVLPCRGGAQLLRRLFEPLGYAVQAGPIPLDERVPAWGDSPYVDAGLGAGISVRELLTHLYVLLPVLDDDKHYWVGDDEIEKLLRRGGTWLASHPDRELIADRYLRHHAALTREAIARLLDDDQADPDVEAITANRREAALEQQVSLRDQRTAAVLAALAQVGARRVLDLGCGDGRLLAALLKDGRYEEIVGVDASVAALSSAARRMRLDEMSPRQRARIRLMQGALTYRDRRLAGYDAAVLMEVVEHLDPARLGALERAVFADAQPTHVIVTTPNVEYNVRFERLERGALRHADHRFEWTRAQFGAWAGNLADRTGYRVRTVPVGPEDPSVGAPTQMAVFSR